MFLIKATGLLGLAASFPGVLFWKLSWKVGTWQKSLCVYFYVSLCVSLYKCVWGWWCVYLCVVAIS